MRECAERKPRIFQRPSSRPISACSRQLQLGPISGTRGVGSIALLRPRPAHEEYRRKILTEISLDSLKGIEGGFPPPRVFATASESRGDSEELQGLEVGGGGGGEADSAAESGHLTSTCLAAEEALGALERGLESPKLLRHLADLAAESRQDEGAKHMFPAAREALLLALVSPLFGAGCIAPSKVFAGVTAGPTLVLHSRTPPLVVLASKRRLPLPQPFCGNCVDRTPRYKYKGRQRLSPQPRPALETPVPAYSSAKSCSLITPLASRDVIVRASTPSKEGRKPDSAETGAMAALERALVERLDTVENVEKENNVSLSSLNDGVADTHHSDDMQDSSAAPWSDKMQDTSVSPASCKTAALPRGGSQQPPPHPYAPSAAYRSHSLSLWAPPGFVQDHHISGHASPLVKRPTTPLERGLLAAAAVLDAIDASTLLQTGGEGEEHDSNANRDTRSFTREFGDMRAGEMGKEEGGAGGSVEEEEETSQSEAAAAAAAASAVAAADAAASTEQQHAARAAQQKAAPRPRGMEAHVGRVRARRWDFAAARHEEEKEEEEVAGEDGSGCAVRLRRTCCAA